LRIRIIVWFLFPTAVILAVVALFTFYTYQRVTEDLVIERNQEVARLLADQLAVDLEGYAEQLSTLAADSSLIEADPLNQQVLLRLYTDRLWAFDDGVVIVDERGIVRAADWRRQESVGVDWPDRSYFQRMAASQELLVSDVITDLLPGVENIVVAVPIVDRWDDSFGGMVAGFLRLAAGPETRSSRFLTDVFTKLREVDSDTIYIVDGAGRAIFHIDTWRIGEDLSSLSTVRQVLDGEWEGVRVRNSAGEEIVAGLAPVPGTSWSLVTVQRWADLIGTAQRYGRVLVLLLVLGVTVPALVIGVGATRITRPIQELTAAAAEVAGGNFGQSIEVRTADELEDLARQFNRMSAELERSYAHLEQRVEDRTRELATLNAIAAVVSRSLHLEEILQVALDKILEVTGLEAGVAYRLDEDQRTLTLMASRGLSDSFVRSAACLPLWMSAAGPATRAEQPIVLSLEEYPPSALKENMRAEGLRMAVSIPLMAKGKVLGAINLGSHRVQEVGPEELSLLASIGHQTGIAVENARLYEQAEETAVAAERSRLARDLHDAVTQTLFSASMIADVLPRIWERDPQEGHRRLEELRQLTRGALAEMRTLLVELRPSALVEAGTGDLLRQLGEAVTGRARVPVTVEVEGPCALPPDVKVAFYRIAQEALNNVVKHAQATRVAATLRCVEDTVTLCIRDDGSGFRPDQVPSHHLGLGIMRERAAAVGATLTIESAIGQGTAVWVRWTGGGEN
jgi:nitrate/nitrite-specific signal transduction histidine kinase